jgi:hypothetical protein
MAQRISQVLPCKRQTVEAIPGSDKLTSILARRTMGNCRWAAPHFLVHLKWEFFERSNIDRNSYVVIGELVLLPSQDALNSFGVAYSNELCGRTAL